ncbi:MAG TPA: hypothetical protein VF507_03375 [Pyrinomonadaceae bacterium]
MSTGDLQRPVCRRGVVARELPSGMVYIRHPKFSSRIINRESWGFLQMCDGRSLEELNRQIAERLGFQLTPDQLRTSVDQFAANGLFEGTAEVSRNYRLFDASPLTARLAPLVRYLESRAFAALTLAALAACVVLLVADWGRFTDEVARAARAHPILTVLLYYLTFVPIALLHELGHAVVIRYHGGDVPEVMIRGNAQFAVLSDSSVLKGRKARVWYLSMGVVVDVYVWLALLLAFHLSGGRYLLLMFLLPQTVYFLIYSYSIFKESDYLKAVSAALAQPTPARPWEYLREGWRKLPESAAARKLLYIMTASLAVKLLLTAFLVWTFAVKEWRVLLLYVVYKVLVYLVGNWPRLLGRMRTSGPAASGADT